MRRKPSVFRHLLHLRAGVGDGHKMAARLLGAHRAPHLLEEKLLQDIRLERGTGFARHDHQRLAQVHCVAGGLHLRRVGGVDDVQLRESRLRPEGLGQHLGAQARAAHAQQQSRLEVGALHVAAQLREAMPDPSAAARQCRSSPSTSPRRRESIATGPSARSARLCCWLASRRRPHPRPREDRRKLPVESSYHLRFCLNGRVAKLKIVQKVRGQRQCRAIPPRPRSHAVAAGQFGVMRISSSCSPAPLASSSTNSGEAAGTATMPRGGRSTGSNPSPASRPAPAAANR